MDFKENVSAVGAQLSARALALTTRFQNYYTPTHERER